MPAVKKAAKPKRKGRGTGNVSLSYATIASIMAAFVMGEGSAKTIAEKHGVCERTAEKIKAQIPDTLCGINADDNRVIGQLLKLYITEAITTCVSILQDLRSPEKLKAQSTSESLSAFGTISERIFLLAEAAERARQAVDTDGQKLLEVASSSQH